MAKSPQQKASRLQERGVVRDLNRMGFDASNTPASGAKWYAKSDAVVLDFLQIELKTVVKPVDSFSIKKLWMEKVDKEAFSTSRYPVLGFSYGYGPNYYVVERKYFDEIMFSVKHYQPDGNHVYKVKDAPAPTRPAKSAPIRKEWLDEVEQRAIPLNMVPLLRFSFGSGVDYYVIKDEELYKLLLVIKDGREVSSQ